MTLPNRVETSSTCAWRPKNLSNVFKATRNALDAFVTYQKGSSVLLLSCIFAFCMVDGFLKENQTISPICHEQQGHISHFHLYNLYKSPLDHFRREKKYFSLINAKPSRINEKLSQIKNNSVTPEIYAKRSRMNAKPPRRYALLSRINAKRSRIIA